VNPNKFRNHSYVVVVDDNDDVNTYKLKKYYLKNIIYSIFDRRFFIIIEEKKLNLQKLSIGNIWNKVMEM
jgi:hypothetical protein